MAVRERATPRRRAGSVDALVAALAAGHTVIAAAKMANMSEGTAHRRLAEPVVRQQLSDMRLSAVERTADRLAAYGVGAVDTLASIVADKGAPPAVRVQAASVVLSRLVAVRDAATVEARLAEIEAALAARDGWRPRVVS